MTKNMQNNMHNTTRNMQNNMQNMTIKNAKEYAEYAIKYVKNMQTRLEYADYGQVYI
jgi:hypothetical protein